MKKFSLFLGGARSGKSSLAEKIAAEEGGDDVLYLATAEAGDEEIRQLHDLGPSLRLQIAHQLLDLVIELADGFE